MCFFSECVMDSLTNEELLYILLQVENYGPSYKENKSLTCMPVLGVKAAKNICICWDKQEKQRNFKS